MDARARARPASAHVARDDADAAGEAARRARPQSALAASAAGGREGSRGLHAWGATDLAGTARHPPADTLRPPGESSVGRSIYLSRGLRAKRAAPPEGEGKGARPAGDLVALREDIWDAVHDMYRVVRRSTADPAWQDGHVDFTGHARNTHRLPSAAASAAGVDGVPAQLVSGDIMIADMQEEIKALRAKMEANRLRHKKRMAQEAAQTWAVEVKVREQEKLNAFLRQIVMTEQMEPTEVAAVNEKAVSNSENGPQSRTLLLHKSMAIMSQAAGAIAGREFTRILPPCPDPLLKPPTSYTPIRLWVLFVQNYSDIYHLYQMGDRQTARRELARVKKHAGRTVVIFKDDDVGDAKHCLNVMRTLVSSRHIGRLRQLGFHGEHVIVVNDDASVRAFDDPVHLEELLRHGDKTLPLMVALPPSGVTVQSHQHPANQMAEQAAKGPLNFQDTIMTAKYNTSLKSKASHTLHASQSLVATRLLHSAGASSSKSSPMAQAAKQVAHNETAQELTVNASVDDSPSLTKQQSNETTQQLVQLHHSADSDGGGQSALNGRLQDVCDSGVHAWIQTFQDVLTCHLHDKAGGDGVGNLVARNENHKRRSIVHRCVEKLLANQAVEHSFHDAVDALDQKTRSDMLEEVASEFSALGVLARTFQSMFRISACGLDLESCCQTFKGQVKTLLNAQHVRLWMVDQTNAQIWEWAGNERHPRKRSYLSPETDTLDLKNPTKRKHVQKLGIAADVARTGVTINVPFPAVQSESFSIQVDRLPGGNSLTILCEPLRYQDEIIAVVQCYNKQLSPEEAERLHQTESAHKNFTRVDERMTRLLCDYMGQVICKCRNFDNIMSAAEQTLHGTGLTWHFPCSASDLFELAQVYLSHVRESLMAQHCVFYVLSNNVINNEKKLWTGCPEGRRPRRYIEIGQGLAGWIAEKQTVVNANDLSNEARFDVNVDAAFSDLANPMGDPRNDFVAMNALGVPIKNHDGSLLGVCVMLNKASGAPFSKFDEHILKLECQHVVLMVKTVTANFTYFSTQETIEEVLYRCKNLVECERVHFFVCDTVERKGKEIRQLRLMLSSGDFMNVKSDRAEEQADVQVPLSDGLLGFAARTGRDIVLADARGDPRFNLKLDHDLACGSTTSLISMPVYSVKKTASIIGVMLVANKHGASAFSQMDRTVARIVGRQVSKLYQKKIEVEDN